MNYLTKSFEGAVKALVGDGPVKQRLGQAYSRHLQNLRSVDLPDTLRERFDSLHRAMHKATPVANRSSITLAVQKMSFKEATAHAETVVELYAELLRNPGVEPLKVVQNDEKPPRYLTHRS